MSDYNTLKYTQRINTDAAAMTHCIQSMFSKTGSGGYDEPGIICPFCDLDSNNPVSYVHFGKPEYLNGNDHSEAKNPYVDVRGDVIILSFRCEEGGHEWVLVLGEHKGSILVKTALTNTNTQISFDSPIEQAFWNIWMSNFSFIELVPQHPIGKYRVDFAHIDTKTAIELDGFATHSSTDDIAKDRKRQREIEEQGWHVIRFGGKEVHSNVFDCALEACNWIEKKLREEM